MTTPPAPAKTRPSTDSQDSHWAAQLALVTLIVADLVNAYPLLDAGHPSRLGRFTDAVNALVDKYGHVSGMLAADYYNEARTEAGISSHFHAVPTRVPTPEQVDASIRWATKDLWTGEVDYSATHTKVEGVADKLVLDVGRDTITDSVADDPRATGFARSGRPNCCAFCAMLISRGAVYKSARSATIAEFGPRAGKSYHDHCHCKVSPFWDPSHVPTAQETELGLLWKDQVAAKGFRGTDALNAFRRVLGRN